MDLDHLVAHGGGVGGTYGRLSARNRRDMNAPASAATDPAAVRRPAPLIDGLEALLIALHGHPTPLPALINSQSVPAPGDPNVAAVRTCLSEATAADLRYSGTSSPPIVRRIHVDTGGDDLDLHFGGPHGRVCHEDDLAHEVADHPSDFAAPEGGVFILPPQATRSRPSPRPPMWVLRWLITLVVVLLTAMFTVAAETGVCLVLVRDVRACVAATPASPDTVPNESGHRAELRAVGGDVGS